MNYKRFIADLHIHTYLSPCAELDMTPLNIPFLAQTAEECNGRFSIDSALRKGTVITAEFQKSHIDMKPLGDIGSTMMVLIGGHPEIDFLLIYEKNGFSYRFYTEELKKELGDVPINLPDVLKLIKKDVNTAVDSN